MLFCLQGVNKHNGETVAVKTFNQLSHMRPQEVQMREFEVLQKVKHENIVKLLAIEEEQEGRGKVIVMELCTGMKTYDNLHSAYRMILHHLTLHCFFQADLSSTSSTTPKTTSGSTRTSGSSCSVTFPPA